MGGRVAAKRARGGRQNMGMAYPLRLRCPHCDHICRVRSSVWRTSTYRHLQVECRNADCLHRFAASEERVIQPLYSISPSKIPNPAVKLALARPYRGTAKLRSPANDDDHGVAGMRADQEAPDGDASQSRASAAG
jgi:hypothetical protein